MEDTRSTDSRLLKECRQELSHQADDIKALQDNVRNKQQLLFGGRGMLMITIEMKEVTHSYFYLLIYFSIVQASCVLISLFYYVFITTEIPVP